jgi:excisionase family DNA binding protein
MTGEPLSHDQIRPELDLQLAIPAPGVGCRLSPGPHSMPEHLLTPREVAEWLCVSVAWVLDHASGRRRPNLPSVKLGKVVRFRREDIEAFVKGCIRVMGG